MPSAIGEDASCDLAACKLASVDSVSTSYAFVLLEIMERNDLSAKKHAATMLIVPFDVMAKDNGPAVTS